MEAVPGMLHPTEEQHFASWTIHKVQMAASSRIPVNAAAASWTLTNDFFHWCMQSYFLNAKHNVILQKSSIFTAVWTKHTAYIVHIFCKEIFYHPPFHLPITSAPYHSKLLWNKEGKQHSRFRHFIILILSYKKLCSSTQKAHCFSIYDSDS